MKNIAKKYQTVPSKRKIITGTINEKYIVWIEELAQEQNIPKSRLIEQGIKLLKADYDQLDAKKQEDEINSGIDFMLECGEAMDDMAESQFSERVGEELL